MIRTIPQGDLNINDGITGENTGLHRALDTIVNSGDIFLRDSAANDTVDELITLAGVGLQLDLNVTILALTAGLAGVLGLLVGFLANGPAVSNLGSANVGLDLSLPEQTVNYDLQLEPAHSVHPPLAPLLIVPSTERRTFCRHPFPP